MKNCNKGQLVAYQNRHNYLIPDCCSDGDYLLSLPQLLPALEKDEFPQRTWLCTIPDGNAAAVGVRCFIPVAPSAWVWIVTAFRIEASAIVDDAVGLFTIAN